MRIKTLGLHNYRKFKKQGFTFDPQFTVLIGNNASGKTQILDAISVLLGTYLLRFDEPSGRRSIKKDEVRLEIYEKNGVVTYERQEPTILVANGSIHGQWIHWERHRGDRGGNATHLLNKADLDLYKIREGQDIELPVLLYYGTGRLWNKHRNVEVGKPESRSVGYRNCLDPQSDHYLFEKWFKQMELSAIQKKKEIDVLESVRESVKECIPDSMHFYFDVTYDALMIVFENEYCLFNNLSDGYRNMVAMVADIAHRAARLNPHMGKEAAKKTSGVVLIDEIDLHLHPKWQRRVVDDLRRTFPNVQFIVTTHSPFIIQTMNPGEVIDLNKIEDSSQGEITYEEVLASSFAKNGDKVIASPPPDHEYSNKPIEDITEDVMGIDIPQRSHRYQEMFDAAKEYYKVLEEARSADPGRKDELKRKLDKLSAPFSDNVAYHAFLEMKRLEGLCETTEHEEK